MYTITISSEQRQMIDAALDHLIRVRKLKTDVGYGTNWPSVKEVSDLHQKIMNLPDELNAQIANFRKQLVIPLHDPSQD